jgi:hypothetical protein
MVRMLVRAKWAGAVFALAATLAACKSGSGY